VYKIKAYAEENHTSVSELVEEYIKSKVGPVKKNNLIELVKSLPKVNLPYAGDVDLTKQYCKNVKKLIVNFLTNVKIIDCGHEITINAVNSQMADIEDALQYYTAMHYKMDYFISADKNLIKSAIPVLPVYAADEFLKEFDK